MYMNVYIYKHVRDDMSNGQTCPNISCLVTLQTEREIESLEFKALLKLSSGALVLFRGGSAKN